MEEARQKMVALAPLFPRMGGRNDSPLGAAMTTFQEKLDALPEMPKQPEKAARWWPCSSNYRGARHSDLRAEAMYYFNRESALRARLDLLLETSRAYLDARDVFDDRCSIVSFENANRTMLATLADLSAVVEHLEGECT